MSEIGNRWTPFGLQDDPFFQEELGARRTDPYPAERYFVGRERELERLVTLVASARSSRTVIEGTAGVGKTSFVNRLKARLAAGGVLTHDQPIRLTTETTLQGFVADVLRTLLSINASRAAQAPAASPGALPTPGAVAGGVPAAAPRRRGGSGRAEPAPTHPEGSLWGKIARITEGQLLEAGGVGLAGFSATRSLTNVPPQAGGDLYHDEVRGAIHALAASTGGTAGRVLLHVNNMETLKDEAVDRAAKLVRNVRDYLLIPGAHWLFVGRAGTTEDVFHRFEEVESVIGEPVRLAPLSPDELWDLLERRYRELRTGLRFTPPIDHDVAVGLYRRYRGDLRNFLRLLSDAAEQALPADGSHPMNEPAILAAVAPRYRAKLVHRIGEDDVNHLRAVCALVGPTLEFRQADVARATGMKAPSALKLVDRLVAKKVLRPVRTEGTNKYYAPTGEASVALEAALRTG